MFNLEIMIFFFLRFFKLYEVVGQVYCYVSYEEFFKFSYCKFLKLFWI